jgi:hypothetical protein
MKRTGKDAHQPHEKLRHIAADRHLASNADGPEPSKYDGHKRKRGNPVASYSSHDPKTPNFHFHDVIRPITLVSDIGGPTLDSD